MLSETGFKKKNLKHNDVKDTMTGSTVKATALIYAKVLAQLLL